MSTVLVVLTDLVVEAVCLGSDFCFISFDFSYLISFDFVDFDLVDLNAC